MRSFPSTARAALAACAATAALGGLGAFSLFALAPTASADVVKARKDGVKIFAEASSTAAVLQTLKKDEPLSTRHRYGSFYAVDLVGGRIGYVRGLEVGRVEDTEAATLQKALHQKLGKTAVDEEGGARMRTSSSVMGVRGLGEDGDAQRRSDVRPDMRHIRAMEEREVSLKRIETLEAAIFKEIEALEKKGQAKAPQGENGDE